MRWWSSCVMRSFPTATELARVDEWILLHQRETQDLERERVSGGKAGKLLHVVGDVGTSHHHLELKVFWDAERFVESRQASVPAEATRHVGCHVFSCHACQDAVLLCSMPAHEALISSAIFRTPSDATTTSRTKSMAHSSPSFLSPSVTLKKSSK